MIKTVPTQPNAGIASIRPDRIDAFADSLPPFIVSSRLFLGVIVIILAEVFSGASLKPGLWHPWFLILTYWLYFGHFFFFTSLAIRTGRTSLVSLYLWGVLYGLYESWITKVIWSGYGGDGKFVLGKIGPYGFSEISMVFLFHPIMAFILPIAVMCLLSPSARSLFPDLAWITGTSKLARVVQVYLVVSFAPVMAMNSGGPINLVLNLIILVAAIAVLWPRFRATLATCDAHRILNFGSKGFRGLCIYLAVLYTLTYFYLRPEALPSPAVQLFTFVFYALAIGGILLQPKIETSISTVPPAETREIRLAAKILLTTVGVALLLSPLAGSPILMVPLAVNFIVWALLGIAIPVAVLVQSVRRKLRKTA